MNKLPDKLTILRKHYNYSQKYIAKILGIEVVDYMGFENGRSVLNHKQILKLSKFYHINYIELFNNECNVTLYAVDKQDTDKINIDYFIPKNTFFNKIKKIIKRNRLTVGIGIGAITAIALFLVINNLLKKPVENEIHNINTLSASNRTILYLSSNGAAKGSGDNSFSQLSNLPTENIVKVLANDEYSVFLLNDGTLLVCGDCDEKLKNEILKKKDVVDIAMGLKHLLILNNDGSVSCIGSNDGKQCELDGTQNIVKIFAGKNASVALNKDGKIIYSGDFVGRSSISDIVNIRDIDFSDSSIIYIKENGTVDYNSNLNNKYFFEALKWEGIVDVACGSDFFVGLKEDGSVLVASENSILKEAESLKNIIAIDAADNYFVAYDGKNIYGFGENRFNQFISSPTLETTLKQVENITINCYKNIVVLSFDPVNFASGYEVSFNDTTKVYPNNMNISLDASSLKRGDKYTITIKALGDDYYKDSDIVNYDFEYLYDEEIKEELISVSLDINQMSKDEFESYLKSLNINNIEATESNTSCSGDTITISDIDGIIAGGAYKKADIEKANVKYKYCKIEVEENHEEDLDN